MPIDINKTVSDLQRLQKVLQYLESVDNNEQGDRGRGQKRQFFSGERRTFKPRLPQYDEPEAEEESEEEDEDRPSLRKRRHTHMLDHLPPKAKHIIHHYYHEIGQKGGRHRGGDQEETGYDKSVQPGFLERASPEEQSVVRRFLHAVQTKKNVGEKEAEEELDEMFGEGNEDVDQSQEQMEPPKSKKSKTKSPERIKGKTAISPEQKKMLVQGRRGRKLSGRDYNVRDLEIDQAEKALSQEETKRGQKRRVTRSMPAAEEEETGESQEEEGESEEEEGFEEEEVQESPQKKKRIEGPRSEILTQMPEKEQEAVLRFYQMASRIASPKKIEEYLKSRSTEEQKYVKKFVKSLQEMKKESPQIKEEPESKPKKGKSGDGKPQTVPKKTPKSTKKPQQAEETAEEQSQASESSKTTKTQSAKKPSQANRKNAGGKKGGEPGEQKEETEPQQDTGPTTDDGKENEPPQTEDTVQKAAGSILGEQGSNIIPPSLESVDSKRHPSPSLTAIKKKRSEA